MTEPDYESYHGALPIKPTTDIHSDSLPVSNQVKSPKLTYLNTEYVLIYVGIALLLVFLAGLMMGPSDSSREGEILKDSGSNRTDKKLHDNSESSSVTDRIYYSLMSFSNGLVLSIADDSNDAVFQEMNLSNSNQAFWLDPIHNRLQSFNRDLYLTYTPNDQTLTFSPSDGKHSKFQFWKQNPSLENPNLFSFSNSSHLFLSQSQNNSNIPVLSNSEALYTLVPYFIL